MPPIATFINRFPVTETLYTLNSLMFQLLNRTENLPLGTLTKIFLNAIDPCKILAQVALKPETLT